MSVTDGWVEEFVVVMRLPWEHGIVRSSDMSDE